MMAEKLKNKIKQNNAGAALIMVIIAIAFVGMLVGMVVYMAYGNYLMKANDKMGKDNFYSAERVLNVINGHLQEESSKSMTNAYATALQSATIASTTQVANYQKSYIDGLYDAVKDAADSGHWDIATIRGYVQEEGIDIAATPGAKGAYIGVPSAGDNVLEKEEQKSITLKNLRIVYTDPKGYVSIIQTDIYMVTPAVSFAAESKALPISDFSLIANQYLHMNTSYDSGSANVKVSGDIYAGMEGLDVGNGTKATFTIQDPLLTSADYNLIAGEVNVTNTAGNSGCLKIDDCYTTFAKNIKVDSGNIILDGVSNIADDLEIDGVDSDVKLSGSYIGYGDNNTAADGSSSILINGAHTNMDFSDLEKLVLSGYAFVGARKYDANIERYKAVTGSTEDTDVIEDVDEYYETLGKKETNGDISFPTIDPVTGKLVYVREADKTKDPTAKNSSDVMMGQSVGTKAEQILYMVPEDCIGFYNDGSGQQYLGKNPMTADEYLMLTTTLKKPELKWDDYNALTDPEAKQTWLKDNLKYIPVSFENLLRKMPNMSSVGLDEKSYKAVYRRINGTVLVYLYIDFKDTSSANRFYENYYESDPIAMENYITAYVNKSAFRWNNDLFDTVDGEDDANFITNSNVFYFNNAGRLLLKKNTAAGSGKKQTEIYNLKSSNTRSYQGLLYLLDAAKVPGSAQMSKTLFENLIDETKLEDKVYNLSNTGGTLGATDPVGITTTGNFVYSPSETRNIKVIIAGGDISISKDFTGLAIAKGDIIVKAGCSAINADKTTVDEVLKQKSDASGKELKALFFGAETGDDAGIDNARESEKNKVVLSDYISYQNWVKE